MAAVLTWVKSKQLFLKIQEGTGDNLSQGDIGNGIVDYVLWNTFSPSDLGIDGELNVVQVDGGMLMLDKTVSAQDAVPDCYNMAFNMPYNDDDVITLMSEED